MHMCIYIYIYMWARYELDGTIPLGGKEKKMIDVYIKAIGKNICTQVTNEEFSSQSFGLKKN